MSRLFYHVMQDNLGNLLFGVTGTMRLAGSGTLATIYGDEALTVILPNPMTNHPSFGSFKCYLGAAAAGYDFYMAKSGYTFETLTGLQGLGTMAQQNANAVAITGGSAVLAALDVDGTTLRVDATNHRVGIGIAAPAYTLDVTGNARVINGLGLGTEPVGSRLRIIYDRATMQGVFIQPTNDTGAGSSIWFANAAGNAVGSVTTTASATAFNTGSDARLKHAIAPLTGALGVVQALRPVAFKWRADDSEGHGFLANEVAEVVDGVVTGEPDALNPDGTINPQMIDYSKLVPWLVGAIQTLTARLAVLEDALGV